MKEKAKYKRRRKRPLISRIYVRQILPGMPGPPAGRLHCGQSVVRCAIGRSGIRTKLREGDGISPRGAFSILGAMIRLDRVRRIQSRFPAAGIHKTDGWCDDAVHRSYNRPVRVPFTGSHERLYRPDNLYDVVLILDYNFLPRIRGRGSAIFFHLCQNALTSTEGCLAIPLVEMRKIVSRLSVDSKIIFV